MGSTLVVLAAGIGSRYGGLKQLEAVGPSGETMIDYAVFDAARSGFTKTVFIVRPLIREDFESALGKRLSRFLPIEYAYQEEPGVEGRKKPWGTGEAVLNCCDVVDGPFGVINADDFYGLESYRALGSFLEETRGDDGEYCMVGFGLAATLSPHGSVARGVCRVSADGRLENVTECTGIERKGERIDTNELGNLTGNEFVSMNMWGLKPSVFGHLERQFKTFLELHGNSPKAEFYLPQAINTLVEERLVKVAVLPTGSEHFGVTYKQDKADVEHKIMDLVRSGVYPANLFGN